MRVLWEAVQDHAAQEQADREREQADLEAWATPTENSLTPTENSAENSLITKNNRLKYGLKYGLKYASTRIDRAMEC